ncbi:MAG: CsbD family protein, partial [Candidatus Sulfotelmatobacter sp.]
HEVKGKVKETAGKVTNNPNLEAEGNAEKNTGKVEKKVGQIEKVFEKGIWRRLSGAGSSARYN